MPCRFRYVENSVDTVVLRLFTDALGQPRGDISGPIISDFSGRPLPYVDRCVLDAELAYFTAIRIANRADCEMVVCGDAALWNPARGELIFEPTRPLINPPPHDRWPAQGEMVSS